MKKLSSLLSNKQNFSEFMELLLDPPIVIFIVFFIFIMDSFSLMLFGLLSLICKVFELCHKNLFKVARKLTFEYGVWVPLSVGLCSIIFFHSLLTLPYSDLKGSNLFMASLCMIVVIPIIRLVWKVLSDRYFT